ncbi:MAG: ammonium transporter [Candidatus Margulisbacteria bacterium GWF2_35_9]|nr:MAG: ammonium transporter [Candidatus Margulisbacteria bacterium GWF2_35_9]
MSKIFVFLNRFKFIPLSIIFLLALSSSIFAESSAEIGDVKIAINTIWVMFGATLVFFMQAGFGMVEAGFIRAKNTCNILTKNFMDFAMASLGFFAVGYAIMFGTSVHGIFGTTGFLLKGLPSMTGDIPTFVHWLFQAMFAGAAATIVAGAMAGRMKFKSYMIYSFLISAVVYPIVGHWVWNSHGWIANMGFLDFAGSTVVHATGGWAAFIGAYLLGARIGKFNKDKSANAIVGHNIPLASLGVFILWFGWFGFNAGSTLSGMDFNTIGLVAINTNLAAAAGAFITMIIVWVLYGKPDLSMIMNGALAGLVAITAPCAFVTPIAAIIIGSIAGVVIVFGIKLVDKLMVDDPVGAVAVHGFNGLWGTLAVGLFHSKLGLFYGGGLHQLIVQTIGVVACISFVVFTMFIIFKMIDMTIGLRVSREEELKGLDISEHGMEAYAGFQLFAND